MRGFAKTFLVLAQIQKTHDDIIEFFGDMTDIFASVSIIARQLHRDGPLAILRQNVMAVFSCALKVLGAVIASSKSRMSKFQPLLSLCISLTACLTVTRKGVAGSLEGYE